MKRKRYSNGSSIKKSINLKGIGDLDTSFSAQGNQSNLSGDFTVSKKIGNTKGTVGVYKDIKGNDSTSWSIESDLGKKSSITVSQPNKNLKQATIRRGNISATISKPKGGSTQYGITFQKRI
jgi:hypothetical protein